MQKRKAYNENNKKNEAKKQKQERMIQQLKMRVKKKMKKPKRKKGKKQKRKNDVTSEDDSEEEDTNKKKNTAKKPRKEAAKKDDGSDENDGTGVIELFDKEYPLVGKNDEKIKIGQNPPKIVFINDKITQCRRCKVEFTANERKKPQDLIFKYKIFCSYPIGNGGMRTNKYRSPVYLHRRT